ncbi:MAG: ClpXP protease specificity-enhancing factor [Pseudohongiellaceae bacterium]
MNSSRPYLVRALYKWILDNGCTPYVMVNALDPAVEVPQEYVKDGQIVLNIAPSAVEELAIANDSLSFHGRFAGITRQVYVPASAIMGIYAKENGQGMEFAPGDKSPEKPSEKPPEKPKLSGVVNVVASPRNGTRSDTRDGTRSDTRNTTRDGTHKDTRNATHNTPRTNTSKNKSGKRPTLRVIK